MGRGSYACGCKAPRNKPKRYMEVAVITSLPFRFMMMGVVGLALAGCAQVPELVNRNEELRSEGQQKLLEHNYADAAGSFRAAARSDPRDYKALYSLGTCYEKMNQFHQAI